MKTITVKSWAALNGVGPGLVASVVIAGAAGLAAAHTGGPIMLFALLIGLAMNFLGEVDRCDKGIAFTSKFVLRLGVALLGLKITMTEVMSLGWSPLLLVIIAVALTIGVSTLAARWMGFDPRFGVLSGGATAICGASAAMAISAALPSHPRKEYATLFTVVGVSILSTVAMILYPVIARFFGLDDTHAGIFIGATVHDVAQVIGAGYSMSTETGDTATIVKLARVAMLLPVIVVIAAASRSLDTEAKDRPPILPWFATAFALLVVANSILPVPDWVREGGSQFSRFCLVAAIAALGMKTRIKDIASAGWRPAILMVLETIFIAGIALTAIRFGWV